MTMTVTSSARAIPWLVLTTLFWGGSFVANKIGFREIPPVTFLFFRFGLATLLMGLYCLPRLRRLDRPTVVAGIKVGIALAATNLSFVLGLSGTTATRAGFLNNLFVLIIPLLCFLLWRDRVDRWTGAGILLALAGLWQLARGGEGGFSQGDILSTVCALFISIHILAVSRLIRDEDVYLLSLVQFATVAALGGLLYLALPSAPCRPGPASLAALAYCAVFPTVVCFTLQNTFQRCTTPTQAGLIYTLDPVWSMLGGMIFLGERLDGGEFLGCAFIFLGVVIPPAVGRWRERKTLRFYAARGADRK